MSARPPQLHPRPIRGNVLRSRGFAVRARGFSFVEILFAIGVLGIGFIMLAAIFPVGLQQTKLTLDETASAANSRSMAARLQQIAQTQVLFSTTTTDLRAVFPETFKRPTGFVPVAGQRYNGQVRTLNDPRDFTETATPMPMSSTQGKTRAFNMWRSIANELIQPADNRSASAVLFKRDLVGVTVNGVLTTAASPTAQVIVINAQVANQSTYVTADATTGSATPTAPKQSIYNLEPRPVAVQVVYDQVNGVYVATFFSVTKLTGANPRGGYPNTSQTTPEGSSWGDVLDSAIGTLGEGAYVVISDDRITVPATATGRLNGRILRLGQQRPDLTGAVSGTDYISFDLAPGYGFATDAGADGYINSTTKASTDDLIGVGIDKNDTVPTMSGLAYSKTNGAAGLNSPGSDGPNSTGVTVDGTGYGRGAVALVLGRGFANPSATPVSAGNYLGPVQDVSAYTTFVTVPNP